MEDVFMVDINTFIKMYAAIGYLQEQTIFSYNKIVEYIKKNHVNDDTATFTFLDLKSELDSILFQMKDDDEIGLIFDSYDSELYRITNKINYKEIIENNRKLLKDMIEVFYNINGGEKKDVYFVPSDVKKNNR